MMSLTTALFYYEASSLKLTSCVLLPFHAADAVVMYLQSSVHAALCQFHLWTLVQTGYSYRAGCANGWGCIMSLYQLFVGWSGGVV
ncbi:hypothetical protein GDO78_003540 [Eleutherodactylus coqui]|uniref:Uncharacterized protein n=1 Tax=Eleutherodactylus coqui TaxID=57060 RepID=A0A8J6K4L2_ELECQ|nr:hypothetical protein GDO78_003540 [Eleutherodactylus coqui]